MPPRRIHHLNFIVRDLDAAIRRFEVELDFEPFIVVDHPPRGVRVARSRLGDAWFVLVMPVDADSEPARYLERHGEGFFLLSLGVDDLEAALSRLSADARGPIRDGILDWRVADIGDWFGAGLQLTQDQKGSSRPS